MSSQHQDSLLARVMQYNVYTPYYRAQTEVQSMSRKSLLYGLIVICITFLVWTWMVRASLCEVHFREGKTEVSAFLNYEVRS